ncbi:MAG: DUF3291 domain-containing protein [Eudoraea sp.]|nr:DUF3291 domain-containing protein [Eudoraea sp.]
MDYHLAQLNIAKLQAPLDHPQLAEFVNNVDRINTLAERSPGFVWRYVSASIGNMDEEVLVFKDPTLVVNLSVWESLDDLFEFTYRSDHRDIFRKRKQWFHKFEGSYMVCWYLKEGDIPSLQAAKDRLQYLEDHGETPYAFTFRKRFTIQEAVSFVNPDKK